MYEIYISIHIFGLEHWENAWENARENAQKALFGVPKH